MATIETEPRPTELPPDSGTKLENGAGIKVEGPRDFEKLTSELLSAATVSAAVEVAPTLEPTAAAGASADGIGLWQSNKQVDATYATYAQRFSWMHVAGGPWRRFSPVSDSGVAALALLAAHARDRGRPVNFREETDQLVHEMYVW